VYPFSLRGSTLVWPKCPFIKKFWGIWTLKFHSLYNPNSQRPAGALFYRVDSFQERAVLCIQVLEHHVLLGPEIERSIGARDVFIGDIKLRASSGCASPKSFFIGAHGKEF
jgi:hypothetical protein